ncbi:hypothetical protein MLD38_004910 [Melastoma candidum]|uniref:Uncharacterized protein n=2 Tax=Melastoma candidum TaxID=119954 RepID=A0ACB9P232_9MYRT|nr:hypothetical protein MLD38_026951 [Melastoma candidum]KAI4387046.1 hypothetical protein MLD38_004910 [Melastoma candidum]
MYAKIGFGVEKKLKEGRSRFRYEEDKVEGEKIVPKRVVPVQPAVIIEDTVATGVLTNNTVSMSSVHPC